MKHLVLVLDASGSMNEQDKPFFPIRFMQLKDEVKKILKNIDKSTHVHLYRFAQTAQHEATWKNSLPALEVLESLWPLGGGTDIWGSLDIVADRLSDQSVNDALVICITDGEDGNNRIQRGVVEAKFASMQQVRLQVLILNTQMNELHRAIDPVMRRIRSMDSVAEEVDEIITPGSNFVTSSQIAIRLPIYPLIATDNNLLTRLQSKLAEVVPFLEKLTGLRYYPIPTYVVDYQSIQELCSVNLPEENETILQDIEEIVRFIAAVCITFHVGYFHGSFNAAPSGMNPRENDYADWLAPTSFPDEYRHWLQGQAEAVHCEIRNYVSGSPVGVSHKPQTWDDSLRNQIPIVDANGWLSSIARTLGHIQQALDAMSRQMPHNLFLKDDYFGEFPRGSRDCPQLDIWQKYLSTSESRTLRNCVEPNGLWKKDICSITAAFRLAVKIVLPRLSEARAKHSRHIDIIRQIRTRGMYMPASVRNQDWLSNKLKSAGLPDWFQPAQTGFVLLCADECADACSDQATPDLIDRFFGSILTHEHAHAICREGIGKTIGHLKWNGSAEEETAVSETLAEWAELEHSRDDAELFEMVSDHATCGTFPHWPYAGALRMERLCRQQGLKAFRRVLDLWRQGDASVYQQLVKAK